MKVIAIANQKGGVGKTATAVNLSAALSVLNHKILLVDLDAQANATQWLTGSEHEDGRVVYDVIMRRAQITDCIVEINIVAKVAIHIAQEREERRQTDSARDPDLS